MTRLEFVVVCMTRLEFVVVCMPVRGVVSTEYDVAVGLNVQLTVTLVRFVITIVMADTATAEVIAAEDVTDPPTPESYGKIDVTVNVYAIPLTRPTNDPPDASVCGLVGVGGFDVTTYCV